MKQRPQTNRKETYSKPLKLLSQPDLHENGNKHTRPYWLPGKLIRRLGGAPTGQNPKPILRRSRPPTIRVKRQSTHRSEPRPESDWWCWNWWLSELGGVGWKASGWLGMVQHTRPKHRSTEKEIKGHTAGDPRDKNPGMQLKTTQLEHLQTTIQQNEGWNSVL